MEKKEKHERSKCFSLYFPSFCFSKKLLLQILIKMPIKPNFSKSNATFDTLKLFHMVRDAFVALVALLQTSPSMWQTGLPVTHVPRYSHTSPPIGCWELEGGGACFLDCWECHRWGAEGILGFDGYTHVKTQAATHAGITRTHVHLFTHTNVNEARMMKPKWEGERGGKGRELMD